MARATRVTAKVDDLAYWPCLPVYGDDGTLSSIILTEFEVFSKKHPRVSSGYSVEALVKKLAPAPLRKRFGHDPEAGMYAAYGDDPAALLAVAKLLRKASGMKPPVISGTPITGPAAAKALANAYIATSDAKAQAAFVKRWPRPKNSILDRHLVALRSPAVEKRLETARFLMRWACRVVGRLDDAFCHPTTFEALVDTLARETDPKVFDEVACTIAMFVMRSLPDLRASKVLVPLVLAGRKRVRAFALDGLGALAYVDWDALAPLLASKKTETSVRIGLLRLAAETQPLTPWILDDILVVTRARFPAKHRKTIAACAREKPVGIRTAAKAALAAIG